MSQTGTVFVADSLGVNIQSSVWCVTFHHSIMTQDPLFSTRIDAPDLNKFLLMLTYMNLMLVGYRRETSFDKKFVISPCTSQYNVQTDHRTRV